MHASVRVTVAAAAVAGLVVGALPAAAHGNYVAADAQVSDDGTVRIELVVAVADAFVVLHGGNARGPVVGHRAVGDGFVHPGMAVRIDPEHWRNTTGSRAVAAVLHHDADGDGRFDPSADPPLEKAGSGEPVASAFAVRNGSGRVNVLAEREHAQATNRSAVRIRRVQVAAAGHLVVRADANGSPGRIVGHRALDAGVHRNVTVGIDEGFYGERPERFSLWAVAHRDDGDGAFEPGADPAVEAGGSPVMSRFGVERTGNLSRERGGTDTPEAGRTETHEHDEETGTHGHDEGTGTHGHGGETGTHEQDGGTGTHGEGTATRDRETDASPTPAPTVPTAETPAPTATATSASAPGFGTAVAVVALALAALLAGRRS